MSQSVGYSKKNKKKWDKIRDTQYAYYDDVIIEGTACIHFGNVISKIDIL